METTRQNTSVLVKSAREEVKIELAKRDFWRFCLYYDFDLFSKRPFLKQVAEAFQEVEEGKTKSLSVSMPPRAGKSYITSLFCAWTLGRNPRESVMRNCCTGNLYLKFSYDVRNILRSSKFLDVFPHVILSDDKKNLNGWNTNQAKQVSYFGAGVGGSVIGYGASKLAVTDDLYKSLEDALSDRMNERIIQWKEATHDSRFEKGCSRIDIGTRWSVNDVIGRQINDNIYEKSIIIPALTEDNKSFCEEVMSTAEYLQMRDRTRPEIWVAEYQQQPVDITGRLFSGLKYISEEEFEDLIKTNELEGALAYIDVADQGADYTAMAIVGVVKNDFFVLDYVFTRDNTDITIPLCAEKLNKWKVPYVRVETNAMGAMFSRHLQQLFKGKVLGVNNQSNKKTRIIMQSAFVTNRFNFVQRDTNEARLFLQNVSLYSKEGTVKHDDAPDCLSGLSIFVQSMFANLI